MILINVYVPRRDYHSGKDRDPLLRNPTRNRCQSIVKSVHRLAFYCKGSEEFKQAHADEDGEGVTSGSDCFRLKSRILIETGKAMPSGGRLII